MKKNIVNLSVLLCASALAANYSPSNREHSWPGGQLNPPGKERPLPRDDSGKPPNIILIVADDLGFGDVGAFAQWDGPQSLTERRAGKRFPVIHTPYLDRLAAQGMTLKDFYSNCSVCSPTRAAIMTGRYQHRSGVINVLGQLGNAFRAVYLDDDPFVGLRPEEMTLAEVLRDAGYRTGIFGKWHLGPLKEAGYHPLDHGFDEFVGTSGGGGNMFSMKFQGESYFYRGREAVEAPGYYYTFVLSDETIDFIRCDDEAPFFAYVPFTAPHSSSPVGPGDELAANAWDSNNMHLYGFRDDHHQWYKEVVEALDLAIGRIHNALIEEGLEDNTLIFFTSDNGPIRHGYPPFSQRTGKGGLFENGIRMPTIAHWPARIEPGTSSRAPAMTMDLLPTFVSLAGASLPAEAPPLDGLDLTPVLTGSGNLPPRRLFWEKPASVWMDQFHLHIWAVRDGDWKLLQGEPVTRTGSVNPQLFNLREDPIESNDLSEQYPVKVAELQEAFLTWKAEVYSDAPFDLDDFLQRLKDGGIIPAEAIE